jgi:hypothetical protein
VTVLCSPPRPTRWGLILRPSSWGRRFFSCGDWIPPVPDIDTGFTFIDTVFLPGRFRPLLLDRFGFDFNVLSGVRAVFTRTRRIYRHVFGRRCGGGVLEKIQQGQWAVGDNEQLNWFVTIPESIGKSLIERRQLASDQMGRVLFVVNWPSRDSFVFG